MPPADSQFPLVEQYTAIRLGLDQTDLRSGSPVIVESARRLRRETSYGFVHVLWWLVFPDGSAVISIPPACRPAVEETAQALPSGQLPNQVAAGYLAARLNAIFSSETGIHIDRHFYDTVFACNRDTWRPSAQWVPAVRITQPGLSTAPGIALPAHCFPDGIVYGIVREERVVSLAYAHRTGVMEDRVADLAVVTAPGYRRQGYGKSAVAAVVRHLCAEGGEARYACAPDNRASRATARAVGFVPYAESLILAAPPPA